MHLIRTALVAALLIAPAAHAADGIRYLELLNRAHDSITAVAIAAAGSGQFQPAAIDPVPGGGGATTVAVGDAGCRYDLQVGFGNGRNVVYSNVDVCRGGKLVISAMRKDARYAHTAAAPTRPDAERRAAAR